MSLLDFIHWRVGVGKLDHRQVDHNSYLLDNQIIIFILFNRLIVAKRKMLATLNYTCQENHYAV